MIECILVAITVATATETTIYYVPTDASVLQHRDLQQEVANLALQPREGVLVIRDIPGLPPKMASNRCRLRSLYATLTGDV